MTFTLLLALGSALAADTDGDGWDDDTVHPDASVPLSVVIGQDAYVGAYATVGEHAVLGARSVVGVRATVQPRVVLGDGAVVSRNASIQHDVRIGEGTVLGRSTDIGAFAVIGSNVSVQYAARIGPATHIGDFVVLGSLTELGEGVTVTDGTVIARSTRVGDHARIGDASGAVVGPDVTIGAHAVIAGRSRLRKQVTVAANSRIGDGARIGRDGIVGASARLGPGSRLESGATVEPCGVLAQDGVIPRSTTLEATCTPATLIDRGAGVHGWSDGHPVTSCEEYRRPSDSLARSYGGYSGSGVYRLTLDGQTVDVYCDMLTDGGGWTLLSRFSQPSGGMATLPQSLYDDLVADSGWILGDAPPPLSPTSTYVQHEVTSHDWAQLLGRAGLSYTLRQRFFRNDGATSSDLPVDYRYDFTFNGHVVQDTVAQEHIAALGVWPLTNRVVLQDASTIVWDTPAGSSNAFWLPFTNAAPSASTMYTACSGGALDTDKCGAETEVGSRRYGNAGITGGQADNADPGAAWAPHFNAAHTYDVVYVHQASVLYGTSGQPMTLQYWIR